MKKLKYSIKKSTRLFFIPIIMMLIILLISVLYSFGSYRKTMNFYSWTYSRVSNMILTVNLFDDALADFTVYGGKYHLDKVKSTWVTLNNETQEMLEEQEKYSKVVSNYLEAINAELFELNDYISNLRPDMELENRQQVFNEDLSVKLTNIQKNYNSVLMYATQEGTQNYNRNEDRIVILRILVIAAVVIMLLTITLLWIYLNKSVCIPVEDIYEWSTMLREGYCQMDDLDTGGNNEISELAISFNYVKEKLAEANKMKAEYIKTTERIKDVEEHKKKFVKQLYDEKRDKEAISNVAKCDGLTGLYNRMTFDNVVGEFLEKRPAGIEGALFLIDMDNFKSVNDTLGHLSGDEALKLLAGIMRIVFPGCYLGRYGGDEFIAFHTGTDSVEELKPFAEALCEKMNTFIENDGKKVPLSVSVGIATTNGIRDYSELYMKADKALYFSKENGRNQYKFESDL